MKEALIIAKKELLEFFRDRRCLIMLMIPIFVFPILNTGFKYLNKDSTETINLCVNSDVSAGEDEIMQFAAFNESIRINLIDSNDPYTTLIQGEVDCYIRIADNTLDIIYNSNSFDSLLSAMKVNEAFQQYYNKMLSESYGDIYQLRLSNEIGEVVNISEVASSIVAPIVLIMLIFQSISSFANDIFAGEKERQTIEMLLLSGVKRQTVYFGKFISIMVITILNSIFGLLSFSFTFRAELKESNIVGIVGTLLMITTISALIFVTVSMRSKRVRSAQMMNDIVTALIVGATVLSILGNFKDERSIIKFIPFFNVLVDYKDAFIGRINTDSISTVLMTNAIFVLLLIITSVNYIKSEKIISE